MQRNFITALEVTAMVVSCAFMIGCARHPHVKDSEGSDREKNLTTRKTMEPDKPSNQEEPFTEGTFELVEINSLEEFRKIYLAQTTLYFGHDDDYQYLGAWGSDTVYKLGRKIVDDPALRRIQAERSKIKYVAQGPPLEYRRSKEFLDWLRKAKLSRD